MDGNNSKSEEVESVHQITLAVIKDESKQSRFVLKGKTYSYRQQILDAGGIWETNQKSWVLPESTSSEKAKSLFDQLTKQSAKKKLALKEKRSATLKNTLGKMQRLKLQQQEKGDLYKQRAEQYTLIHERQHVPPWFPKNGICHSCQEQIFERLGPATYKNAIQGCPYCHRSFGD
jgi:hypothetical protein